MTRNTQKQKNKRTKNIKRQTRIEDLTRNTPLFKKKEALSAHEHGLTAVTHSSQQKQQQDKENLNIAILMQENDHLRVKLEEMTRKYEVSQARERQLQDKCAAQKVETKEAQAEASRIHADIYNLRAMKQKILDVIDRVLPNLDEQAEATVIDNNQTLITDPS